MAELVSHGAPWPAAVAVSGGGDSIALMHLLSNWAEAAALPPPVVVSVDHGLRDGSGADARKVSRWAKAAGLKVKTLVWRGEKPVGDIEAAAREARYRLMGDYLRKARIGALYVAHTRDDQAETFLLRLARGSGLDGLSAMAPIAPYPSPDCAALKVVRPLLRFDREALRAHLAALGQAWIEDPMNEDPRFGRVRIRASWPALEALGLGKARLSDAALHLSRAREALDDVTAAVIRGAVRPAGKMLLVDGFALTRAPRELGLRALARILMTVSGRTYRPRFERLERLFDRIAAGQVGGGCTLHGCQIAPSRLILAQFGAGTLQISPERRKKAAVANGSTPLA